MNRTKKRCEQRWLGYEVSFLEALLPEGRVSFDVAPREERSTDWGTDESNAVLPDAVVWPETTAEVSDVLAAANENGVPVTPYAAGTSIEGNPVPVAKGITMGGTSTGEHGVGLGKQEYLALEHGDAAVDLVRRIERAFDPNGTLNPGKVFTEDED